MRRLLIVSIVMLTGLAPISAQEAKEIKTKKGTAVALVNLLNARQDCTANMNPVALPIVKEKPGNGTVQMTVSVANVGASGGCPARKVPVITLIYVPIPEFAGSDAVTIEVDDHNKATLLSYKITVQGPGDSL
jgi:hypothetical protein